MFRIVIISLVLVTVIDFETVSYIVSRNRAIFKSDLKVRSTPEINSTISLKVVDKPHHLFIGRCNPQDEVLHGENVILNNDGKSQVNATIRMNVEGSVYITCVKVLDQVSDGEGAYPSFVGGGVGYNYVIFNVTAAYGKGFNFYVQINGHSLEESDENLLR